MVETEGGGGGWIGSGQPQRRNSENRNSRVGNRGHKCSNVSKRCAPPARLYYTLFLSPEVIIVCEFLAPSPREKQRHFSFPPADTLFPTHPFDNRRVFPSFARSRPSIPYLLFRFVTQSSTTTKERTGSDSSDICMLIAFGRAQFLPAICHLNQAIAS